MVKKVPSDKQELSFGTRWDKLRTWHLLKDEIEAKCQEPEKFDCGITIDIGPQVLQTQDCLVQIQRGDRGSGPPWKTQVIWVSIGNKQLDPPW